VEEVAEVGRDLPDGDVEDGFERNRQLVVFARGQDQSLLGEHHAAPDGVVAAGHLGVELADEVRDDRFRHVVPATVAPILSVSREYQFGKPRVQPSRSLAMSDSDESGPSLAS